MTEVVMGLVIGVVIVICVGRWIHGGWFTTDMRRRR